jgi:glycosyltransferase involved in cell wall biosynthesis
MRTPKKYTNLHVPWHTHFYRAGLSFFVASEKPWHTHCYRAFQSLGGNKRYAPVGNVEAVKLAPGEITWNEFESNILAKCGQYRGVFVLNSVILWDTPLYQRPQHICSALGKMNYLVIYKTVNWKKTTPVFKNVSKNVWATNDDSVDTISGHVQSFYSTTPWEDAATIRRRKGNAKIIYEYMDVIDPALAGSPENLVKLTALKNFMFEGGADAICPSSKMLYEETVSDSDCPLITLVPNGVEVEHYRDVRACDPGSVSSAYSSFRANYKTILGYFGAIAPWLWHSEIEKFADMRPDVGFVFIGPAFRGGGEMLPKRKNILALGPIPYKDLPCYAKLFDICFIPFEPGEVARATSPLKLFEYFALEKPVIVTSDLLECVQYKEVFHGSSAREFSTVLDKALLVKDSPKVKKCYARLADQNSWIVRARQFAKVIDRLNTNAKST